MYSQNWDEYSSLKSYVFISKHFIEKDSIFLKVRGFCNRKNILTFVKIVSYLKIFFKWTFKFRDKFFQSETQTSLRWIKKKKFFAYFWKFGFNVKKIF